MKTWNDFILKNKDRWLAELTEFLSIPSVSTKEAHQEDMAHCATWVKTHLLEAGCDFAAVCPTAKHAVVFGQCIIDPKMPTVLVYGHYDVQPAEPLELWQSDPFKPIIKDGNIIARGASDDKGQLFMHIKALEMMHKSGRLPCNIKFIIEGEEEIGSPSLKEYLSENKRTLSADMVLASDTAMISMEQPSIDVSLRGMTYLEIEVTGPNRDIHSGVYGGAIANPLNTLCKMIASLRDEQNRITIPGFYDKVKKYDSEARQAVNDVPFDLASYEQELGVNSVEGEEGFTTLERTGIRPSLDVNGIWGGYTEPGAKTIIPAKAFAKISMRLVDDQDPDEIARLFEDFIRKITPASVTVAIRYLHGGKPVRLDAESRAYHSAVQAIAGVFDRAPLSVHSGGSIPVVAMFKDILNLDALLLGFGLDDDRIHSPNEKFGLENFFKGIETIADFYQYFSGNSD